PIKSRHELTEVPVEIPNTSIDLKGPIEYIGRITSIIDQNFIIKYNNSGEYRILKENSILCFEDRKILGPLFEVFGSVYQPFFRVIIPNDENGKTMLKERKIGDKIFYDVANTDFVFTQEIK
ncbi:RNA-binding snoRNP assembly protein ASCRUDRAFT_24221, partial [Ascoidea rubescens DSM 1968]